MDEIQNRVASSALMVFDLEDYYPEGIKTQIDLAVWLTDGFLLKEKEFRKALAQHDWSQFQDQYVAIYCSTDAILPAWAEQLVAVQVLPFAKKVVLGKVDQLDELLYPELLAALKEAAYHLDAAGIPLKQPFYDLINRASSGVEPIAPRNSND